MSIYRRFRVDGFPSLVTTNTASRNPLFRSRSAAQTFLAVLDEVLLETGFRLLAFVVMPDHVHLVLLPAPRGSLGRFMQLLKGRFSRRYNGLTGECGSLWQSRYHERMLRTEGELLAAIRYVHWNPVQAGLAGGPSEYDLSSAHGQHAVELAAYLGQAEA